MWVKATLRKCDRCEQDTELLFKVSPAFGDIHSCCPRCVIQAAEAAITEAEVEGSIVPGGPLDLAPPATTIDDAVALAKQELFEHLLEMFPEVEKNLNLVRVAELGVSYTPPADQALEEDLSKVPETQRDPAVEAWLRASVGGATQRRAREEMLRRTGRATPKR